MGDSFFTPYSYTLEKLFDEQAPMFTSRYQRDYAWEREEVIAFVNDIDRLRIRRNDEPGFQHFFGAIVAVSHERRAFKDPEYEILDGQQRLATFSLTLALLRLHLLDVGKRLEGDGPKQTAAAAENLKSLFLEALEYNKETLNEQSRRQFKMVEADEPAFNTLLTSELAILEPQPQPFERDSHRLLRSAWETINESLFEPLITDDPLETFAALREVTTTLLEGCEFIFIKTSSRDHATQLFQVLNDRGRRLEASDLLRAHTLMLVSEAPKPYQARVADAWDAVDRLPRKAVEDFLRHRFASYYGMRVAASAIAKEYRARVFGDNDSPLLPEDPGPGEEIDALVGTVEALAREARAFDEISRGVWPFPAIAAKNWTKDRLFRLVKTIQSDRVLPLLLSAYSRGPAFFTSLVPSLEKLEFRAILSAVEANKIANMYFDVAALIRSEALSASDAIEELESWILRWKSDEDLRQGIAERCQYSSQKSANYIKHLLTTLEDYRDWLSKGANGIPKPADMHTWDMGQVEDEHIFPQRPDDGVPADLRDVMHRLGNQTFWGPDDNKRKEASNRLPTDPVKIEAYLAAQPQMTKDVGALLRDNPVWGKQEILERELRLIDAAIQVMRPSERTTGIVAILPPSRTSRFESRADGERKCWLVMSKEESLYADRDGEVYEYLARLPNGKRILAGDVLITFRPPQKESKTKGLQALPARVIGWGPIDRVEHFEGGARRRAHISSEMWRKVDDIPIETPNGGVDPRKQVRNAMVEVGSSYLYELKKLMD